MKKSILSILTVFSLICSLFILPPNTHASEDKNVQNIKVDREDTFFNPTINKYMNAYKVVDGQLVPIGLEEYQQLTEYSEQLVENDSDIQIEKFSQDLSALYGSYYTFTPSSTSTLNAPIEKASASINCTVKICTVSKIYNTTYSESFTAGLTADAKSTIKLNAGFTWVKSATNGSSYSFTVDKGVSGYIGFNAYYRKTTGVLQEYIENLPAGRKVVEGRAPKTLSTGELDGIYSWVYTN